MDKAMLKEARGWIQAELFERCLPFWLEKGMDAEYGGILTCLTREGRLYSPDKSVWFQGRAAWIFARLCNVYGPRQQWLDAAKSCLDFLEAHCFLPGSRRMYFSVTRQGAPLRARRYHFSEMFYAIACAEYGAATGEAGYMEKAREAAMLAWRLYTGQQQDPTGYPPKTDPATRRGITLAEPLMFLNTVGILRRHDAANRAQYDDICAAAVATVLEKHLHPEHRYVFENVGEDGQVLREVPMGRLMNPGHVIEASWFILEEAAYRGDAAMRAKAMQMFDFAFAAGWDEEYGGLLAFVDLDGLPPEPIEHDMKYWWPHTETLISTLMMVRDAGEERYLDTFATVLDHCKTHFADAEYGEWYGYLRRDGSPTLPAPKGNLFKGPFHLPRMLIAADGMLGELLER